MRANLITGGLLLILSVVFWFGADAIPKSRLGGTVGADGLPKMLAMALGLLTLAFMAQTILTARAEAPERKPQPVAAARNRHLRALGMIAIGAVYVAAVPTLGYIVSVGLLLLAVALYNGKRPSPGLFAFAGLGAVFFYFLFVKVLDVPLPPGFWPRLIG